MSLSWGLDERRTGREEAEETDKWLSALLDKARNPSSTGHDGIRCCRSADTGCVQPGQTFCLSCPSLAKR